MNFLTDEQLDHIIQEKVREAVAKQRTVIDLQAGHWKMQSRMQEMDQRLDYLQSVTQEVQTMLAESHEIYSRLNAEALERKLR